MRFSRRCTTAPTTACCLSVRDRRRKLQRVPCALQLLCSMYFASLMFPTRIVGYPLPVGDLVRPPSTIVPLCSSYRLFPRWNLQSPPPFVNPVPPVSSWRTPLSSSCKLAFPSSDPTTIIPGILSSPIVFPPPRCDPMPRGYTPRLLCTLYSPFTRSPCISSILSPTPNRNERFRSLCFEKPVD